MNIWKITTLIFYAVACLNLPAYCAETVKLRFTNDADVFAALQSIGTLKKDKYEKTADFNKRICAETYKALGVNDKTYVTLWAAFGEYATHAHYDADKQAFVFVVGTVDHFNDDNIIRNYSRNEAIQLALNYTEAPKPFTGKNEFGIEQEFKVGLQNYAVLYLPGKTYNTKIILPAKPEEARKLDGDLRLAIETQIQTPCFKTERGHKSPTLQFHYDMTTSERGFMGSKKSEWIIYRDSTKEVLKRGKFKLTM